MRQLLRRALFLLRFRRLEADLAEEMAFHEEMKRRELESNGVEPIEAGFAARRALGNATLAKEEARTIWLGRSFESLWQDLSYMARRMRREPGFVMVAAITVGIGLGANTAVYTVIRSLILLPPPFEHAEQLVSLFDAAPPGKIARPGDIPPSPGNFLDWRAFAHTFDHMAAWRNWYYTLGGSTDVGGGSQTVRGVQVSPDFFPMLSVRPALGRTFRTDEEQPGLDHVVIISGPLWRRRFAADPAIVGTTVHIDGQPFVVVGVLPENFRFLQRDFDLWMPLPVDAAFHSRTSHSVAAYGRLASGVTLVRGEQELAAISSRLAETFPDTNAGWSVRVRPIHPTVEAQALQPALLILLGAAGVVLLIACVNTSNLLLAQGLRRQKEIAVRAALGAGRARLVRQLLIESIGLGMLAAAIGTGIAYPAIRLLTPLLPHAATNQAIGSYRDVAPSLDAGMLAASLMAATATGLVFGVLPAFRVTQPDRLRTHDPAPRFAMGRLLMAAELALSIVLLVGAALLIRSFWNLQRVDPGFAPDHLLTAQVWLPKSVYPTAPAVREFYGQALERIGRLPAVQGAGVVSQRPFLGWGVGAPLDIEGRSSGTDDLLVIDYRVVSPGYVRVLGQPLLSGRDLEPRDGRGASPVAVINQAMAQRFWPGQNPIGKRIRPQFQRADAPWEVDATATWLTVVGVVGNVKELHVSENPWPEFYISYQQFPTSLMFLVVRITLPPEQLLTTVERAVHDVDPDQPISLVQTMDDAIAQSVPRINVQLLAWFAAVALCLSAIGVYGVTSYIVSQRRREFGIRMALGASARDVRAMIAREACVVLALGVTAGVIGSLLGTRVLSGLLFGIAPTNPGAYVVATTLLSLVVMMACIGPARRASRIDPAVVLRES